MSLTIDEKKVRESLAAATKPAYVVVTSHLVSAEPSHVPAPALSIGGTMVFGAALISPEAREEFASMRHKIEASGMPLKGIAELTSEIDEMRGRSK
jgi:hypothetical protein